MYTQAIERAVYEFG